MPQTGTAPPQTAPATERPHLLGLVRRLVGLGFALGRALGTYARGVLEAGPAATAEARAGFDLGAVLAMLRRGVGWASALHARLRAEEYAAAVCPGAAVPATAAPVSAGMRRRGALGRAAQPRRPREGHAPWRAEDDAEWAAAIAGRPVAEVVTQICRDMITPAVMLGNARLVRAVVRVMRDLAQALDAALAPAGAATPPPRPYFTLPATAGGCGAGAEESVSTGPLRPG